MISFYCFGWAQSEHSLWWPGALCCRTTCLSVPNLALLCAAFPAAPFALILSLLSRVSASPVCAGGGLCSEQDPRLSPASPSASWACCQISLCAWMWWHLGSGGMARRVSQCALPNALTAPGSTAAFLLFLPSGSVLAQQCPGASDL